MLTSFINNVILRVMNKLFKLSMVTFSILAMSSSSFAQEITSDEVSLQEDQQTQQLTQDDDAQIFQRQLELKAKMLGLDASSLKIQTVTNSPMANSNIALALEFQQNGQVGIHLNSNAWKSIRASQKETDDVITRTLLRWGFLKHDFVNSAGFGLIHRLGK